MKKITLILITLLMLTCISSAADLKETIGGVSVITTVPEGRTVILKYAKDASKFSQWVVATNNVTLETPTSTTVTFTMPATNVEIIAEEVVEKYKLSVSVDGEMLEEMERKVGESITLTAIEGNGKKFDKWEITGLTGVDATTSSITFSMPSNNVEVIATFKEASIIANANVPIGAYIKYTPTATSAKAYDTDTGYTTTAGYQEFNPSATTSWRVMYNNNGQLDIVSADAVYATDGSGLYLYGETGYAKAVDTLNNLCSAYVNTTYATSGRSIGCTTQSTGTITTPITWDYTYNQGNTGLPYDDTYYETDVNQLSNNNLLHSSGYTWLASRILHAGSYSSYFYVRYLSCDGHVYYDGLYDEYSDGYTGGNYGMNGVRPVVSLSSDIKIIDGEGTATSPYIITK